MRKRPLDAPRSGLRSLAWDVGDPARLASCYLAGPMTGLPDFNVHAFRRCSQVLRACGWTVYSPVERDEEAGINLEGYPTGDLAELRANSEFDFRKSFSWDIEQVCSRDAVIAMPGWEESTGASIEVETALLVGTPVYTYLSQRKIEKPGSAGSCSAPTERAGTGEGDVRASSSPTLPVDSPERKALPITSGVLDYFPNAVAEVAAVSKHGNDKHNPGEDMHHARGKSMDHADSIARHLIERGSVDPDTGQRHSAELAWRALAMLQQELEDAGLAPLPRGARE